MKTRILTILLLGIALVGCKPSDDSTASNTTGATPAAGDTSKPAPAAAAASPIIGKWTTDDKTMVGASLEFKDGGELDIQAPWADPKGSTLQVDATYKLDGDKLSFHMVGTKMLPPDGADDKVKKQIDEINKKLTNGPKQPDETDTVAWKGNDTFTGTDPKGKVTTYTRKS